MINTIFPRVDIAAFSMYLHKSCHFLEYVELNGLACLK